MQILHRVPPTSSVGDYFYRLYLALLNQEEIIIFDRPTVRRLYMKAYPKAKV